MRFSLVSMPSHFLLHRIARGTAARVVRTQIFMSVRERDYLQYSWIVLSHYSTVTAVSRVSVDKFLVSLVSNDHIYHIVTILSCLC